MSEVASTITGQFSKALVIGSFLPATLFSTLFLALVVPFFPDNWRGYTWFNTLDIYGDDWRLISIALFLASLSGVLYGIRISIIRLYEGYPWKDTALGAHYTAKQKEKFNAAHARWTGIFTLLHKIRSEENNPSISAHQSSIKDLTDYWTGCFRTVVSEFPSDPELILPTRLGNTMRSSEYYADRQYGIEPITVWPRLLSVIDEAYASAIEDAQATLQFLLTSSFLSLVLAATLILAQATSVGDFHSEHWWTSTDPFFWILGIVALILLSVMFYRLSIPRAAAWGSMVKGAFDLYRRDLLPKLGVHGTPENIRAERDVWRSISMQLQFGDRPDRPYFFFRKAKEEEDRPVEIHIQSTSNQRLAGRAPLYVPRRRR